MTPQLIDVLTAGTTTMQPERLTDVRSWHGHIPFAFAVMAFLRPQRVVELGTHKGDSFCAFCQAVAALRLECACHAVDTWRGDPQAGLYGAAVFAELKAYVDQHYTGIAVLHQALFDDALAEFSDGSIDLLHIDGLHTYEAVKHDFQTWRPKLSDRALVLFHDTQVFSRDFGVWRFWQEIRGEAGNIQFLHANGLGVLGIGRELPEPVTELLSADSEDVIRVRRYFQGLGQFVGDRRKPSEADVSSLARLLDADQAVFGLDQPKVSVIIPAYNHERYIREAVYSVLNQTETDFELIIIDDGSTDGTSDAVASITDPRIRQYRQENQGAHATLNQGVERGHGEWVAVLNSDDFWHPERLHVLLAEADRDPAMAAVFSQVDCIDSDGLRLKTTSAPQATSSKAEPLVLALLGTNFLMTTSNLVCRRTVLDELGGFSAYRYVHDWDFFLRLCDAFSTRLVERPLVSYRIHSTNTIKESGAAVKEESARMMLDFLMNLDLDRYFPGRAVDEAMAGIVSALDHQPLDRIMLVPLLFTARGLIDLGVTLERLAIDVDSPFRKAGLRFFQEHLDAWQDGQEAWKRVEEANTRLDEQEAKLRQALDERDTWWRESQRAWKTWEEANAEAGRAMEERDAWWRESQKAWKTWEGANAERDAWWRESQEAWKTWEGANAERDAWWRESQKAWSTWKETNQLLASSMAERDALHRRCLEVEASLTRLRNSRAFRLGTGILAPARVVRSLFSPKE